MAVREMKDSGIAWIGMAPVGWAVKPIKHCVEHRQGGAWGEDETTEDDSVKENVVCIRVADFDYQHYCVQSVKPYTIRSYDKQTINKLLLQDGDILVEKSGGGEKTPVGRAIIFNKDMRALYANFLERFRIRQDIVPQYFLYSWNSFYKLGHTRLYIKQTTGIQNLDFAKILANESILVPSVVEQKAIVNFLDTKCAEIDSLSADIEKQIETLQEYKKSVITEAVTKGLDPNVEMKDSGVEWIGDIPNKWSIRRIKNHFRIIGGNGFSPNLQGRDFGDYPVCKASDISRAGPTLSTAENFITVSEVKLYSFNIIPEGSILFAKIGEAMKKNNRTLTSLDCCADNNCQGLKPINFDKHYAYFLFKIIDMTWFDNAGTVPCINNQKLKDCKIPYPEISEQKKIAEFLSTKCSVIDATVEEKQKQLETLAQYKQSLIYEYVTGKKAVPM